MSKTPMDHLLDKVEFGCCICKARMGACDCWARCSCGWSYASKAGYERAKKSTHPNYWRGLNRCGNPIHRKRKAKQGGT